jgi:hypothetical protein
MMISTAKRQVQEAMDHLGLDAPGLARLLGLHRSQVHRWLDPDQCGPSQPALAALKLAVRVRDLEAEVERLKVKVGLMRALR